MNTRIQNAQDDYRARIQAIHRELGIPADYETRFHLSLRTEADQLTGIGEDIHGRSQQLAPRAAEHWRAMQARAQDDQVALLVVSAFRSVDYQRDLMTRKLTAGRPIEEILKVNAAPGYSEHHTGCALDLAAAGYAPLETNFETTDAFAWLMEHANRFGFRLSFPRDNRHGIVYEPWHWAYLKDQP
ncbi:MAG: M15 family metallopeptidase [Gammaproteobacteria bacterium]